VAYRLRRSVLRPFVMTSALALLVAVAAPGVSASSSAAVAFEKMCTPEVCTVTWSSNAGLIPVDSTLTYTGPRFDPHLSSGFVLDTGSGTALGHCTLSWATGIGHCVIGSGTGSLAGVHAVFSESVDFADGAFEHFVFHLDGAYHID
jgi:hypothetical protein